MTVGHPYIRGMWQSSSVAAWSVACPGRPPVRSTVAATSHRRPVRAVCGPGQQLTSLRRTEPVQGHQDAGGGDPPARHPTRTRPDGRWTSRSTGRWCVPGAPPPRRNQPAPRPTRRPPRSGGYPVLQEQTSPCGVIRTTPGQGAHHCYDRPTGDRDLSRDGQEQPQVPRPSPAGAHRSRTGRRRSCPHS